jgi:hypothetical protein
MTRQQMSAYRAGEAGGVLWSPRAGAEITPAHAKLVERLRYTGGCEWQVLSGAEQDLLPVLEAAGLAYQRGAWVFAAYCRIPSLEVRHA